MTRYIVIVSTVDRVFLTLSAVHSVHCLTCLMTWLVTQTVTVDSELTHCSLCWSSDAVLRSMITVIVVYISSLLRVPLILCQLVM